MELDELMRQKLNGEDPAERFPFQEAYWEEAKLLLEAGEAKRRRWARFKKYLLWGVLGGCCWIAVSVPFWKSNDNLYEKNERILPGSNGAKQGRDSEGVNALNGFGPSAATAGDTAAQIMHMKALHGNAAGAPPQGSGTTAKEGFRETTGNSARRVASRAAKPRFYRGISQNLFLKETTPLPLNYATEPRAEVPNALPVVQDTAASLLQFTRATPLQTKDTIAQQLNGLPLSEWQRLEVKPLQPSASARTRVAQATVSDIEYEWSLGVVSYAEAPKGRPFGASAAFSSLLSLGKRKQWAIGVGLQWRYRPVESDVLSQTFVQGRFGFGYTFDQWQRRHRSTHSADLTFWVRRRWRRGWLEAGAAPSLIWLVRDRSELIRQDLLQGRASLGQYQYDNGSKFDFRTLQFNTFVGASWALRTTRWEVYSRLSCNRRSIYVENGGTGTSIWGEIGMRKRI